MKYYDVRKPLYLETDSLGMGMVTTLLQVSNNLNYGYDKVPDNAMLWPIVFTSIAYAAQIGDTAI